MGGGGASGHEQRALLAAGTQHNRTECKDKAGQPPAV